MFGPENIKFKEGQQLLPQIDDEARAIVTGLWGMDHVFLDHLAAEVMSLRRYDMPLTFLTELTQTPVCLTRNPGGYCTAFISNFYRHDRQFGDCVGLCQQLCLDENFWSLLGQTRRLSDSRLVPYLTRGLSPSHFCRNGQIHYWLTLRHEKTKSSIILDPSFQRISLGAGYQTAADGVELVEKRKIPRGSLGISRVLARYEPRSNPSLYQFTSQAQTAILGMTESGKILSLAFGEGGSNLKPILPIACLLDRDGQMQHHYLTPNLKTIFNANSQKAPPGEDIETLVKFFSIAANFSITWGNY